MRISDWSSDVCSSDLLEVRQAGRHHGEGVGFGDQRGGEDSHARRSSQRLRVRPLCSQSPLTCPSSRSSDRMPTVGTGIGNVPRSEEHTSELQSLMRISYAVFCLKKKKKQYKNAKKQT